MDLDSFLDDEMENIPLKPSKRRRSRMSQLDQWLDESGDPDNKQTKYKPDSATD